MTRLELKTNRSDETRIEQKSMEAKLSPYYYKKGNEIEIQYIGTTDGFKITLVSQNNFTAILVPIDEIEELIKYFVRAAEISGNTLNFNTECKMRALDVTESKIDMLDEMENKAIGLISEVLSGKREVDDLIKIALQSLNIVAKNRQILTSRQAIGWSIANTIASPEELKRYIAVTNPELTKILVGNKKEVESNQT